MSLPHSRIILASTSPRRRELLSQIGVAFDTLPIDVDESPRDGELPEAYVTRIAAEKSLQGQHGGFHSSPVLAADTEVVLGREILGKPRDQRHGEEMLRRLSGREHKVLSGVSLRLGERHWQAMNVSTVRFRELSDGEIAAYWTTGEPRDKAGAYGIQGLGVIFISHLEGSYSGVMGLPLYETAQLLQRVGINVLCRDVRVSK
ncbi:MAG: Maf-like protein Metme [Proteobacteria bacterium]|nr:Maf-like protein Metme [Pseudomonadota bacterium]